MQEQVNPGKTEQTKRSLAKACHVRDLYHSAIKEQDYWRVLGMIWVRDLVLLIRLNLNAFAVDPQRQQSSAGCRNGSFNVCTRFWFYHQCEATAAASAADFAAERSVPPGGGNDAVNHRRGNRSEIPPAEFPLLADQASNFGPLVAFECGTYLPRDYRDFFEVLGDAAVAINVPHEDFPVVDSGLPRLARITKHQAAFQLIQIAAKRLAPFAPRCEDDGGGASKCRRVMVLRAGRNADDDGLDVAADVNPI